MRCKGRVDSELEDAEPIDALVLSEVGDEGVDVETKHEQVVRNALTR